MRQAFELAWSTAFLFLSSQPITKGVDDITFVAPVEIGDIVTFTRHKKFNHREKD